MARGGPSTGGSKGGGNVVPTNQPTMSDNAYRGSRPFPSGSGQPISPRGYTNIFTGPSRFPMPAPGTGTIFRPPIQNPRRNPFPGGYDDSGGRRNMPLPDGIRGFPSQQPRYPMPRNPYSPPPNRYGGMRGPTGLGGFLAQQPPIRQRQIDFGTGFPTQQQVEQDRAEADAQAERDYIAQEAEADARETARQKEEERKRYQPGGSMSRTRPADEKTTYQQMLEGTYQPDDRAKSLGYTSSSGKGGSKGGARNVRSPAPGTGTIPTQPQPDIGMDPYGTQSFKIDPDILDRGTVYRPPNQISSDRPMMLENPMLFGNNPPPSPLQQSFNSEMNSPQYQSALQRYEQSRGQDQDALSQLQASQQKMQGMQDTMGRFGNNPPPRFTQGLPERPMMQSQGPESLMRMGRAPNIRSAMSVGKATGGPVGLASLIGRY